MDDIDVGHRCSVMYSTLNNVNLIELETREGEGMEEMVEKG